MLIIGITGKMGAGKTTISKNFNELGVPVFDADVAVHQLLQNNSDLQEEIKRIWPQVVENKIINRALLGKEVFSKKEEVFLLEKIIYKYLSIELELFLKTKEKSGFKEVILDVPLLYETNLSKICDCILLVMAPYSVRYERVMKRSQMTPEKFDEIESLFLKDEQKKADFKIQTDMIKNDHEEDIKKIFKMMKNYSPRAWNPKVKLSIKRVYFGA